MAKVILGPVRKKMLGVGLPAVLDARDLRRAFRRWRRIRPGHDRGGPDGYWAPASLGIGLGVAVN
jgi:hypothetical protein